MKRRLVVFQWLASLAFIAYSEEADVIANRQRCQPHGSIKTTIAKLISQPSTQYDR